MSKDELERKYKEEKNPRVKGDYSLYCCSTKERGYMRLVPGIVKRARSSIEGWLRRWNEQGYAGLIPEFTGGPKPKIDGNEWDRIVKEIESRGMTIKDVTVYVKESRRVSYSYKTVWQILSEKEKEGQVWQPVHKEQQEA